MFSKKNPIEKVLVFLLYNKVKAYSYWYWKSHDQRSIVDFVEKWTMLIDKQKSTWPEFSNFISEIFHG